MPDLAGGVRTTTVLALVLATVFSALPILTGESKERNERRFLRPDEGEGADNIKWSVMGLLAFFPFLNPLASWVVSP